MSGVVDYRGGSRGGRGTAAGIIGAPAGLFRHTAFFACGGSMCVHTISTSLVGICLAATEFDEGNNVTMADTTITRYTAPEAGIYYLGAMMTWGNAENDRVARYVGTQINKNGGAWRRNMWSHSEATDGWGSGNSYQGHCIAAIGSVNEGDYFEIYTSMGSQSNLDAVSNAEGTFFQGWKIS